MGKPEGVKAWKTVVRGFRGSIYARLAMNPTAGMEGRWFSLTDLSERIAAERAEARREGWEKCRDVAASEARAWEAAYVIEDCAPDHVDHMIRAMPYEEE